MPDLIRLLTLTQPLAWLAAGLVLVMPVLRYASWQACRNVRDAPRWSARESR